jgi:16S rRNA (guanine966-N2)-methyltransferase
LSFCDLYAGSGAVGLEAASRGADPVLLVESDRGAVQLIRRNAADLGLVVEVAAGRVEHRLRQPPAAEYNVVFADPPYELAAETLDNLLRACVEQRWVSPDGLLIIERSRRTPDPVWPSSMAYAWTRAYGETTLHFGSLS